MLCKSVEGLKGTKEPAAPKQGISLGHWPQDWNYTVVSPEFPLCWLILESLNLSAFIIAWVNSYDKFSSVYTFTCYLFYFSREPRLIQTHKQYFKCYESFTFYKPINKNKAIWSSLENFRFYFTSTQLCDTGNIWICFSFWWKRNVTNLSKIFSSLEREMILHASE